LLFTFFFSSPQEYIDSLLALLDEPSDGPIEETYNNPRLTDVEVLSLDIYAHWLVLLVLVEVESWWVRNFPILGLQSLIRRYKNYLVEDIKLPHGENVGEKWWPASMLEVIIQVRQWK
jgi:hypothetical protein